MALDNLFSSLSITIRLHAAVVCARKLRARTLVHIDRYIDLFIIHCHCVRPTVYKIGLGPTSTL